MTNPRKQRGEYRVFYEAFFTGPDFLKLSADARQVLHTLKGLCGVLGIRCWAGVIPALSFYTGRSNRAVQKSISELISAGWIEYDEPMIWVKRGLEFEPQMHPDNHNHRKSIQDMASGLPTCDMVKRFKRHYAAFFGILDPAKVGFNGHGMGDAIPPSHPPIPSGEAIPPGIGDPTPPHPTPPIPSVADAAAPPELELHVPPRRPAKSKRKATPEAKFPGFPPALCHELWERWRNGIGRVDYGYFRATIGPMFEIPESERLPGAATNAELAQALREYIAVAPHGRQSPFVMKIDKAADCLGALARIVRQHPEDPLARQERTESLIHGRQHLAKGA